MSKIVFTKKHFQKAKEVSWDDIIKRIEQGYETNSHKIVMENNNIPPTIVCHNDFYPNTILEAYNEVAEKFEVKDLHTYVSFGKNSSNFGRHKDSMDVLIVQAIGSIEYFFDDGSSYKLEPGDSLFIPKGVYHSPSIIESRATLSFGL